MEKLTEDQKQKLQRVMQEYYETMLKFDEIKIRKKLGVSDWGWLVGILIPIVLAILIFVILMDPIMSILPGGWMNLFGFVDHFSALKNL